MRTASKPRVIRHETEIALRVQDSAISTAAWLSYLGDDLHKVVSGHLEGWRIELIDANVVDHLIRGEEAGPLEVNRDFHSGKGFEIDHVIHTPGVLVSEVEFLTQTGDRHF